MVREKEIINKLTNIGLSNYESQVLTSIYSLGKAKATEISKYSNVPKAKIYGVLDSLCNKRLIRMHATKPMTYSPIEPKEFFNFLEQWEKTKFIEKENQIKNLKKQTKSELNELFKKSKAIKPTQELVEIIKLGAPSHFETKNIINRAKKELCFLTEAFEYLPIIEKELNNAIKRKVNIKIILASEKNIKKEKLNTYRNTVKKLKNKNIKLKFSSELFNIRYTLNDPEDKKICSSILVVKEYDVPKDMRNAVFSRNQSFVKGLKNHFLYFLKK